VIVVGAGGVAANNLGAFDETGQADSTSAGSSAAERDTGALAEVPALSSASFDRDVAALLADEPAPLRPDARQEAGDSAALPCPGPAGRTEADRRTVQLDGAPALLLVHPEHAGRQLVEAWTCEGEDRLAATRVRR
jgi:hypothetical protein